MLPADAPEQFITVGQAVEHLQHAHDSVLTEAGPVGAGAQAKGPGDGRVVPSPGPGSVSYAGWSGGPGLGRPVQARYDRADGGLVDVGVAADAEDHAAVVELQRHIGHGLGVGALADGLLVVVVDT